ncbi:NADH-quinone oxidoreductase subunit M [Paenarthrobacter sp. DKR-5]|uniref:complex I subunit 4 family protein n=1 Tax=Paenarthrobacter sp. DKR-5 TaxID=2835535 RepID=UPI001BDCE27F|nr:NADH-quinone oxidoreductase subunit M [Paenarthrobacter sp. DKR-5]MBT1003892.1 NADH-quinone oxidoreductase subunit M [Paenarthrobacter sp. DKR-5]
MLSLIILLPLAAAAGLAVLRRLPDGAARTVFALAAVAEVVLTAAVWLGYSRSGSSSLAYEERLRWIPNVGSSYHLGVDGLSLPLLVLTAVIFLACAVYDWKARDRARSRAALFLFLEATCMGLFAAQDLILFFLFFDLSIVGMYFVIAGWGHGDRARSALKFFLYTFLGSLALLVGFIGLYLASDPHTFDIPELAAADALRGNPAGGFVLAAILVGLAVKTPVVPFHTWLPPAHTDAPASGSAVLAGVLLKMGAYGFVRIAMPLLPDSWRAWAPVIITVGVVSVLYGALVALAQSDLKRMIAYTSVNHMGYIVLALGAAGAAGGTASAVRATAVTGAVTQMVSHGLITGALFLLAGVLQDRAGTYDMGAFGGLAGPAPRYAGFFAVAAFASLGLPGFSGFIAEFQVFAGSIGVVPVVAVALPGIVITAALFLRALQRVFTGPAKGRTKGFGDLRPVEMLSAGGLLVLSALVGLLPGPLLGTIAPAADAVIALARW